MVTKTDEIQSIVTQKCWGFHLGSQCQSNDLNALLAIGPEMDPAHTMAITFAVFSNRGVAEEKKEDRKMKRRAAPLARTQVTAGKERRHRGLQEPGEGRRLGSQGQAAAHAVSRRSTGRGIALTEPREGRLGTRPVSKCRSKARSDGAEGLPKGSRG